MYTAVLFKWHHTTIALACEQTLIWSVRGACGLRNFADVAHPPTCNYPVTSMSICVNNVIIPVKFWWCHIIIHLIVFSLPFFLLHRHARLGENPENEVGRFPPPPHPPVPLGDLYAGNAWVNQWQQMNCCSLLIFWPFSCRFPNLLWFTFMRKRNYCYLKYFPSLYLFFRLTGPSPLATAILWASLL